jgi:hypothetical protein
VRRYRNLIHVSDIVKCDGQSLDEFIISDLSELSCVHTFPREQPTATDFPQWNEAIGKLCSGTTSSPYTLGHFLRKLHLPWSWYTTTEADHLYRDAQTIPPLYITYCRQRGCVGTRYRKKFNWIETAIGAHPGMFYASVTMRDAICAVLHSTSRVQEIVTAPTYFLETPQTFGNSSLWENLLVDGDGEWIRQAVLMGSLRIAHDGSYMPEVSTTICSAGVIKYCKTSKCWLKLSIAEQLNAASNYRGELLGALVAHLILRDATTRSDTMTYPQQVLLCNNCGVVSHGNSPLQSLPEKQKQADLIRLMKLLSSTNKCPTRWDWVEGHAVEQKGWHNSTLPKRLNHQSDILVKDALTSAIAGGSLMKGDFPFEPIRFKLSGKRVCSSPQLSLEKDWGYRTAWTLFMEKDIIRTEDFHLVWWDRLDSAMTGYPKMYRVWLTKHVSEFCGSNVQLYYWSRGRQSPKCESCGIADEYTMHISRRRDPGRNSMFRDTVQDLGHWMVKTLGKENVSATVMMYLLF